MNSKTIFFIDPQSEGSLALYDYFLISNVALENKVFICNVKYDGPSIDNTRFYRYFDYLGKRRLHKGLSYFYSLLKLSFLILRTRPSIIHIQWFRLERVELLLYKALKFFCGFKLVYTAHNVLPHSSGLTRVDIYKRLYDLADAIIVHSKNTRPDIEALGVDGKKIHVIRHGILTNISNGILDTFSFREKYGLGDKIIFSISGVQNAYKGTDILIKAWASSPLLYNSDKCVLVIMGKNAGINYDGVSSFSNVIIINRFFSEEEQRSLFDATDVLLLPYVQISQSGVLLSALPYRIPLLVSNIGGLSETLDEADLGWIIEAGNVDELANKLIYLVQNHEEIKRIKNNKTEWEKILNYYSWEEIGSKTKELYVSLVQ